MYIYIYIYCCMDTFSVYRGDIGYNGTVSHEVMDTIR